MKILVALAVAFAVSISGCTRESSANSEVALAMKQFVFARAEFLDQTRSGWTFTSIEDLHLRQNALPNYLKKVVAIDNSRCPKDFRIALLEYRQSLERMNVSDFRAVIEMLQLAKLDTKGVASQNARADALRKARFQLERVALRYGVESPSAR